RHLFSFQKEPLPYPSAACWCQAPPVPGSSIGQKNLVTQPHPGPSVPHQFERSAMRTTFTTRLPIGVGLAALIAFAVPALAADPPKAEAPKAEAPSGASPEAVAAGKSIDWEKADPKAKKAHMKKYVLPQMKKLFAAVDKKYAKMTCETCHGKKAAENKFKMPSAEL